MGWYSANVVPRITNIACGSKRMSPMRERAASGLSGDVVEVGFGTGLNVPFYPSAVARVMAVEPSDVSKRLAATRVAASKVPIDFVGLDGARLPLGDESADYVLSTWTLCTIPEVEAALSEVKRVLRSGGEFHFVEHGRSPDEKVARAQDRWTPLNMRIAGGCHLNRPILELLNASGLEVTRIDRYYIKGPKQFGYMYEGIAAKV
ncbi:MAG TPA: class I SAM-dependent methyltransferase [Acidimicrobiales bacterium]|nr:class I SAM-dependent methyltransferase [Acidimicrobiales bacterium]